MKGLGSYLTLIIVFCSLWKVSPAKQPGEYGSMDLEGTSGSEYLPSDAESEEEPSVHDDDDDDDGVVS